MELADCFIEGMTTAKNFYDETLDLEPKEFAKVIGSALAKYELDYHFALRMTMKYKGCSKDYAMGRLDSWIEMFEGE